jgi:SAM-dependent methyltransferase
MNTVLEGIEVDHPVLDIGGGHEWAYHEQLGTDYDELVVLNVNDEMEVNILGDAEQSFPFQDDSFETVLCLNTMQYLYDYRTTIAEAHRVLRPGGQFVVAVPFLQLVHGHPVDYQRFTEARWRRELDAFDTVEVFTLSHGPISAAAYQLYPMLKLDSMRYASWVLSIGVDGLFKRLSGAYRDVFADDYPLFYVIKAQA